MVKSLQKLVNAGASLPKEMAAPFAKSLGLSLQARVKPYQVESTAKLFSIDFEERALWNASVSSEDDCSRSYILDAQGFDAPLRREGCASLNLKLSGTWFVFNGASGATALYSSGRGKA